MSPLTITLLRLAVILVPLLLAARLWRIFPATNGVLLAFLPALASFSFLLGPHWWPVVVGCDALWVAVMAAGFVGLLWGPVPQVERSLLRVASLGKRHSVELTLINPSRRAVRLELRDGVDPILAPEPDDFYEILPPQSRTTLSYELRPGRRGAFSMGPVYLRLYAPWKLWFRQLEQPVETSLHVYPDMKQMTEYAVLARRDRLNLLGLRRHRRVGQDHDFERLRDYNIDDNYRHIDWRATARRRKLTVKDFQSSQSQQLVFLVDCGRMMTNEAARLSLLDHALNAMLMLSYVALRKNDKVGLVCFSDEILSFVPPRSGMSHMNRLLHASFDRFPRMVESRYDLAFRHLAHRVRRRSLVILVTNLIDEVNASQVEDYLGNLVGRHLPLGVFLRDRGLFDAVERYSEEGGERLWTAAAAAQILSWRHQVFSDLQRKGTLVLDVFPDQMTTPLVNRYLEVKARHLL